MLNGRCNPNFIQELNTIKAMLEVSQPTMEVCSTYSIVSFFIHFLETDDINTALKIWKTDSRLRRILAGYQTTIHDHNSNAYNFQFNFLFEIFKKVIILKNDELVSILLQACPQLIHPFTDGIITPTQLQTFKPLNYSTEAIIENFKFLLRSKCKIAIDAAWMQARTFSLYCQGFHQAISEASHVNKILLDNFTLLVSADMERLPLFALRKESAIHSAIRFCEPEYLAKILELIIQSRQLRTLAQFLDSVAQIDVLVDTTIKLQAEDLISEPDTTRTAQLNLLQTTLNVLVDVNNLQTNPNNSFEFFANSSTMVKPSQNSFPETIVSPAPHINTCMWDMGPK